MARITKEDLHLLANNIMLDLKDEELTNLSKEFDVILQQMDLVQKLIQRMFIQCIFRLN